MAKYLDETGLSHFWDKIKDYVDGVISSVGAITGVKGNAETTYRTGNVNLTCANIGAAEDDHEHSASDITSGTLADARLPTKGSAGTAGTSSATSGATLAVPYITTDAYGRVTAKGTHTHTINSLAASAISSGTLGVARGGTGIADAGAFSGSGAGTDVTAAAASTWYQAHSISVPAGKGILIANISLSSGTSGTIYARLTNRTLAQTKTDDPNYQTNEDGIWFQRAEGNVLCNGHIIMFYNNSAATTYYLHWKSLSTSSALRFGRIAYMKISG